MIEPNFFAALLMTILWPMGLAYCSVKYLTSRKSGSKTEMWFWFIAWCSVLSMVEWFVWFAIVLSCYVFATTCLK